MPFLIDGYNLLRAVQKMDSYADMTDVQLCRYLAEFLRAVRDRGMIVFDGIGPPDKRELFNVGGIEIKFSGDASDADSYIEWKIDENTAPRRLIVVSSDRRLRTAAARRKAKPVPVDQFWAAVCSALDQNRKTISEPPEKRQGLTARQADVWLEYFKLNK